MQLLSTATADLETAAAALRSGGLVAVPTETVYGLAADVFNPAALARIFEAKRRPHFDPLIVHIDGLDRLDVLVDRSALSSRGLEQLDMLSRSLWPGPLTLILPKKPAVPDLATSGLDTVAVRFPAHPVMQALIAKAGPLAAPSANPFGYLSPTCAQHVVQQLGQRVDFIIDGGPCDLGVESTVLDLTGDEPCILRPGGLPRTALEEAIGPVTSIDRSQEHPTAPGQLKSHYAPHAPLSLFPRGGLDTTSAHNGDVLLYYSRMDAEHALAGHPLPDGVQLRVLSETGDHKEAAQRLFALLHELDDRRAARILAEEVPPGGLGDAVNDRLRKACAINKN